MRLAPRPRTPGPHGEAREGRGPALHASLRGPVGGYRGSGSRVGCRCRSCSSPPSPRSVGPVARDEVLRRRHGVLLTHSPIPPVGSGLGRRSSGRARVSLHARSSPPTGEATPPAHPDPQARSVPRRQAAFHPVGVTFTRPNPISSCNSAEVFASMPSSSNVMWPMLSKLAGKFRPSSMKITIRFSYSNDAAPSS
jgi:hypothetical protein